jgi:Rrf2 family protein
MLSLTRKTEYALIAACHLARLDGQVASARDIADKHQVPLPLLMNVLKTLAQRGLVRSVRGSRGGYVLARAPEQMTLTGLVEAVEGPVRLVRCIGSMPRGELCELEPCCSIRSPVWKVHERLRMFLDTITVAELAFGAAAREPALYLLALEGSRA